MRFLIMWLALALMATCAFTAPSEMDIDYSHSVVGTGTLITDYHMGDEQSSEASGKVRGTGNVMNKYLFLSGNDSQNVTVEDEFVFSDNGNASGPTMDRPMDRLPTSPPVADGFRLTGAAWAEKLEVMSAVNASVNTSNGSPSNSSQLSLGQSSGQMQSTSFPIAGKGRFNFTGNRE